MLTTYERGFIDGQRQGVLIVLQAKFGPLSPPLEQQVQALSSDQIHELINHSFEAQTLKDLRLED